MKGFRLNIVGKFIRNAYLLFWISILTLGGLASAVFHAPIIVMKGITVLCSWTPTIMLLIMFKKLMPGLTIGEFYRKAFRGKIKILDIVIPPIIVGGIFISSLLLLAVFEKRSFAELITFNAYELPGILLYTFLQGPTGEESAWRGYLRPEFERKFGFIKGNLQLGLVWTFWHFPLWLVSSAYTDWRMVIYIPANLIIMTSLTLFMGYMMKICNNLFIAFWIHFCFNLSFNFFAGDIYFFIVYSVIYSILAVIFLILMKKHQNGK